MTGTGDPAFFGYGSLVNRATHGYADAVPATVEGWRRVWRQTRLRPFAFLSVEPAEARIDGLIVRVPGGDWAALDAREAAYQRHNVMRKAVGNPPDWAERIEIYAVDPGHTDPDARHPILLSYLDAVAQGFLREFGADGVERFFATTIGWTAVHDDRREPIYPRHQRLAPDERSLVDNHIAEMGLVRHGRP